MAKMSTRSKIGALLGALVVAYGVLVVVMPSVIVMPSVNVIPTAYGFDEFLWGTLLVAGGAILTGFSIGKSVSFAGIVMVIWGAVFTAYAVLHIQALSGQAHMVFGLLGVFGGLWLIMRGGFQKKAKGGRKYGAAIAAGWIAFSGVILYNGAPTYEVWDLQDLDDIRIDPNANYILMDNIDASPTENWNGGAGFIPMSVFTGILDGNSYIISNLYMNNSLDYVGLFGQMNGANVSNLGIVDAHIETSHSYSRAGVLAGQTIGDSQITKVFVTGEVDVGTFSSGSVGGLIGESYATSGYGSTQEDCYARVNVNGGDTLGGFIGWYRGNSINCYSTGAVTGGSYYWGGLFGYVLSAVAEDCFWDKNTSGQTRSAEGDPFPEAGKTTAEMKTESTFTDAGWDFDTVWAIDPALNDGYPFLQWQITPPVAPAPPPLEVTEPVPFAPEEPTAPTGIPTPVAVAAGIGAVTAIAAIYIIRK